jgi:hypothetical protein
MVVEVGGRWWCLELMLAVVFGTGTVRGTAAGLSKAKERAAAGLLME